MNNHRPTFRLLANCLLLASLVAYASVSFGGTIKESEQETFRSEDGPPGWPWE